MIDEKWSHSNSLTKKVVHADMHASIYLSNCKTSNKRQSTAKFTAQDIDRDLRSTAMNTNYIWQRIDILLLVISSVCLIFTSVFRFTTFCLCLCLSWCNLFMSSARLMSQNLSYGLLYKKNRLHTTSTTTTTTTTDEFCCKKALSFDHVSCLTMKGHPNLCFEWKYLMYRKFRNERWKKRFQTFFSSLNLQSEWKRWQKWLLLFLGFLTDSKQTKVSEWIWFSSFIQIVFLSSSNFLQQNIDFGYSQDQHLVIFLRSRQTKFFTQTLFACSVPSVLLFVRDASRECEKSKRLVLLIRYFGDA